MISHAISDEKLLAYVAGELPDDDWDRVAAHVARCGKCSAIVQRIMTIRVILRMDDSVEPPLPLLACVGEIFQRRKVKLAVDALLRQAVWG